jgi:hypothetical protein
MKAEPAMKNASKRSMGATSWCWLMLVLGVLAVPAVAGVGAPEASLAAPRALDLETVLESARAAAKRDAWTGLSEGLLMNGTTDAGGVDATYQLFLAADGRYRFEIDGRLAQTLAFDGRDAATRNRSGPTRSLELSELETWHYSQWIHSGYWLDPDCPLRIELADETADVVTLRMSLPDSPTWARLVLDRESWFPSELRIPSMGAETVFLFQQYEPIAGLPIARLVHSSSHGEDSELRVLEVRAAPADPGSRYELDWAPPSDVHFDPERHASVELKRAVSGHLLVHPLVDGRDVGWFILDSGAGQICIDPKAADELGLESFGSLPAVGVAGAIQTSYRQGESLELGPMLIDDPVFVEIDLSFLAPIFGVEVGGICGYEVFARAVVELDFEQTSLALYDPGSFDLGEDIWTRLFLDGRIPAIRCQFEGDRAGLFKIDLGDPGTISFYSPAVKSLRLLEGREVSSRQVGGVGGMGQASTGTLEWFEVGGHRVESLQTTFSQTEVGAFSGSHALGNLGTLMLKPFTVVFDYTNARIALVPRG